MTAQELREKIVKLIKEACLQHSNICTPNGDCRHCKYDGYKDCTEYAVAYALIAAGIGDVKDLQAQVDALEITNIALQAGYDGAEMIGFIG